MKSASSQEGAAGVRAKRFGIDYENTIEANLELWSKHTWERGGDEWDGQAMHLGVPYDAWKRSLCETFIAPYIRPDMTVLEIACGHGRWSEIMQPLCQRLILIDLNPECIERCQERFSNSGNVECLLTDGKSLPGVVDSSVDFVWSFDSFVHMDEAVIRRYFVEIARVLTPAGRAVIHHAGRNERWRWFGGVRSHAKLLRVLYTRLSMGTWTDHDGWRSNVSAELIRQLATDSGLDIDFQTRHWGERHEYGVPRFRDMITGLKLKHQP
jgi:ubiquinone/menaquinone biosynthesis C-methylase UbiE